MPGHEAPTPGAGEWADKAEHDLKAAEHLLRLGEEAPTDAICFHAQQRVEKYIKALMAAREIAIPKIHDIEDLISSLPEQDRPRTTSADEALLTQYAIEGRYPGFDDVTLTEAQKAVGLARQIREEIRGKLPSAALTRNR
jgi:HEPN domain-containing protein